MSNLTICTKGNSGWIHDIPHCWLHLCTPSMRLSGSELLGPRSRDMSGTNSDSLEGAWD